MGNYKQIYSSKKKYNYFDTFDTWTEANKIGKIKRKKNKKNKWTIVKMNGKYKLYFRRCMKL